MSAEAAAFLVFIIALCVFGWTHRGNHDAG